MPTRPHAPLRPRRPRRPWAALPAALALIALAGAPPATAGIRLASRPLQVDAAHNAIYLPVAHGGGASIRGAVQFAGLAIVAHEGSTVVASGKHLSLRATASETVAGFTAHTGDAGGVAVLWERLDAVRLAPGMALEFTTEDIAGKVLGQARVAPGDLGLDVQVDPDGTGAGTHHIEARLAGRVVARVGGHAGVAARTDTWPIGLSRAEARLGGLPAMRLHWDGAVDLNIPNGPVVSADELVVRSEAAHAPAVMARFALRLSVIRRIAVLAPVLMPPRERCAEAAAVGADGAVAFPSEIDPASTPTYHEVADDVAGTTRDLFGAGHDTSLDAWYGAWPCPAAIGDAVPAVPPLEPELAALGVTSAVPALADELERLDAAIGASTVPPALGPASAVDASFAEPSEPFRPDASAPYGGRDVIYVHGLRSDPLADAAAGNATAIAGWTRDVGAGDRQTINAAFYAPGGYWKAAADASWATHVGRMTSYSSRDNRYLTVAWPATQRLDVAAHAVLAQIADAMALGTGVVVPIGGNAEGFCQRPNCVIVSHGAGALLTDTALHLAATGAYPGTAFAGIPPRIKAHLALHGAFGGSELATAVVGQALGLGRLPDGCALATHAYRMLDPEAVRPVPACAAMATLADSALRDLVPSVASARLAAQSATGTVPALLVAGAHASFQAPLKHALLPGFDDGVATLDSQCGSPGAPAERPSRYVPAGTPGLAFDLGLVPQRAAGYFREQAPAAMAAGCTPYTSPAGMLQPVADGRAGTSVDALARSPRHHTFLVTSSDHVVGPRAQRIDRDYRASEPSGARSWEEVRVITDPAVYAPDARFPAVDPAPLIARSPEVEVHARGRNVVFDVLRAGRTYRRTWYLWQRTYLWPEGSETLDEVDYVYRHVLRP